METVLQYAPLHEYKWFIEQEAKTWSHPIKLPLTDRLWLWRNGFTSPCGKLYDFDAYHPARYLSELQRFRLYREANGRHRHLIDDKLIQHRMMADFPENRPIAYGLIDNGSIHGVSGTVLADTPIEIGDWVLAAVRRESALVLKHVRGLGGKQVHVCRYDDGYVIDTDRVTGDELIDEISGLSGYLVTEFVEQHEYAARLYPNATNTIRLLTMWDDATNTLLTPMAIHRIGTDQSQPVDNWSSGGLSAEINLETGALGPATQYPYSGAVHWYSSHPDTGSKLAGTTVPNWQTVRSTIEEIALDNTHIPIIGWDVVVNRDQEPIIIEANTGSDIDLLQVHRPLLTDPLVANLVSKYLSDDKSVTTDTAKPPRSPAIPN